VNKDIQISQSKLVLQPLLLDMEQAMEVLSLGKSKIYELIETECDFRYILLFSVLHKLAVAWD